LPKAKPTQVIVHRIELQQSERDALEAALLGRFATNAVSSAGHVLTGIGNLLVPFSGVLTAFGALWIGDRSLEMVREDGERRKRENERSYEGDGADVLSMISAYLITRYAESGWRMAPPAGGFYANFIIWYREYVENTGSDRVVITQWFGREILGPFLRLLDQRMQEDAIPALTPADMWDEWYSTEQYGRDAYYWNTRIGNKPSVFLAVAQTLGIRDSDQSDDFDMWGQI
tara:strand:- start:220 stop:909 length:690 start_codon:yes stop_codon:yes gene_type:complete